MKNYSSSPSIKILLVEDNPGDIRLIQEAFKDGNRRGELMVTPDGEEAWAFLNQRGKYAGSPRPDMIWLDLNLPRMDGRELLEKVKETPEFLCIPVVILSSSSAEQEIVRSYRLHANCFITKPVDLDKYFAAIQSLVDFWSGIAELPNCNQAEWDHYPDVIVGNGK